MQFNDTAGACATAVAAVFSVAFWAARPLKLDLPANRAVHFQRTLVRPAVQRTLPAEGLGD